MSAVLSFITPPPGFTPHTEFVLDPVDGADGLFRLDAVADEALRLFVVDPHTVVEGYEPVLTDQQVAELGMSGADDVLVLVVASRTPDGVHVNLLAPIVANPATGVAAQVILDGQDYPLRAALG
ncbi:flagellar assembly protein FliW [Microbacterium sp. ARD32]|uniref:flagellar assembly protein FliW n=1 Tax=Microbacterium sp. ARD32 TaxID=2962577 RepID=UPI0028825E33|nr:flagellar assembly protein FliW [Microbacterium sp. ARD32]MDT0156385.1 flagellar assembly protein FliW [Microbacterium sp. ARD32]